MLVPRALARDHVLVVLIAVLSVVTAACTSNAQVTISDSEASGATAAPAGVPTAPATPAEPTADAVTSGRVIPPGFAERSADSYRIAVPESWTTLTDEADLDDALDRAATTGDFPAGALEGYRTVLAAGDGLVALGDGGDNFNAFRQPGTAAELGDAESLGREVENQFKTFAEDVAISAAPRFLGDLTGIMTSGRYTLNGQQFYLYQFATAHEDHIYFLTVTLLTGPDQELADQILGSLAFN